MSKDVPYESILDLAAVSLNHETDFSSFFPGMYLIGRVRGRIDDPYKYHLISSSVHLAKDTCIWAVDVIAVNDSMKILKGRVPSNVYLTKGTIAVSGISAPLEGSLVKIFARNSQGKVYAPKMSRYNRTNSWSYFVWSKGSSATGSGWYIRPCEFGNVNIDKIKSPAVARVLRKVAETGVIDYPDNVGIKGSLSWNGNNISDDEGIAPPSKGSIMWRQRNEAGYSFVSAEGKSQYDPSRGQSESAATRYREANNMTPAEAASPYKDLTSQPTYTQKKEYAVGKATGNLESEVIESQGFHWPPPEHKGFDTPYPVLLESVNEYRKRWCKKILDVTHEIFAEDKTVDRFLYDLGSMWIQRVFKGTHFRDYNRPVLVEAVNQHLISPQKNGNFVRAVCKLKNMILSDFDDSIMMYVNLLNKGIPISTNGTGEVYLPSGKRIFTSLIVSETDIISGNMNPRDAGAIIVLLVSGIRLGGKYSLSNLYEKAAPQVERMYTLGLQSPTKMASFLLKYGSEAFNLLGMPEFVPSGYGTSTIEQPLPFSEDKWVFSHGQIGYMQELYGKFCEGLPLNEEDVLVNMFRPQQTSFPQSCTVSPIRDEYDLNYSSQEWVDKQIETGCIYDLEGDDGDVWYYSLNSAWRSNVLWNRLLTLEQSGDGTLSKDRPEYLKYGTEFLAGEPWRVSEENVQAAIDATESALGFSLDQTQKDAVKELASGGLGVLTGVAGSGKSTVLKCMIDAVKRQYPDINVALAAPTGKAARRMTETTGLQASTMHSMFHINASSTRNDLGWVLSSKERTDNNSHPETLPTLFVFDEVSMCGFDLMCKVMSAVSYYRGCKVLLVGDKEQLPPVLDVPVFGEILSLAKHAYRLGESHRAAEGSLPTKNSYQILKGKGSHLDQGDTFKCISVPNESISTEVIKQFISGIQRYGIDGCRVVTPFKKGKAGTQWGYSSAVLSNKLSEQLSEIDNYAETPLYQGVFPPRGKPVISWKSGATQEVVRIGDRVMNTENTRDVPLATIDGEEVGKEPIVVNGQEGVITNVLFTSEGATILVDMHPEDDNYSCPVEPAEDGVAPMPQVEGKVYCMYKTKVIKNKNKSRMSSTYMPDYMNAAQNGAAGIPEVFGGGIDNLEISYAETVHKMQGSENQCIIIPVSSECVKQEFISRALIYTAITRASKEVIIVGDMDAIAASSKRNPADDPYSTLFSVLGYLTLGNDLK